jgi:hypothetical protein
VNWEHAFSAIPWVSLPFSAIPWVSLPIFSAFLQGNCGCLIWRSRLSVWVSVRVSVHVSLRPSVYLSLCPSVHLSVCLPVTQHQRIRLAYIKPQMYFSMYSINHSTGFVEIRYGRLELNCISLYLFLSRGHYTTRREGRGFESRWGGFFFNLPNPSSRTMAVGSTQPLTEMSTKNLPGG